MSRSKPHYIYNLHAFGGAESVFEARHHIDGSFFMTYGIM